MNCRIPAYLIISLLILLSQAYAQGGKIVGYLENKFPCAGKPEVSIDSVWKTVPDSAGYFELKNIPHGSRKLLIACGGQVLFQQEINFDQDLVFENRQFFPIADMEAVIVTDSKEMNGFSKLGAVSGGYIIAGKKNDLIMLGKIDANLALNNSRQVFSKVAGVNIWENDGSGIQMNVSTRGLSPNRSWEFNMRKNGYDIAADIMGYPDMYYSPPLEAVANIELVRGAASLQYGTQLGGLLNFKMKRPPVTKKWEIESKQTVGSYGLFSSYNSLGGERKKLGYFGYFYHRSADGWRENSDYKWRSGYGMITWKPTSKLSMDLEFTVMNFLLHLSAGLSESQYKINHQQSVRDRNWFRVNWNIPALTIKYELTPKTSLSLVSSLLIGKRYSVENTKPVNLVADTGNRDIRKDQYLNLSVEARLVTRYKLFGGNESVLATGLRYYNGRTARGLGLGNDRRDADFTFLHPDQLEYNDYTFRNKNLALFAENIFRITKKLSVIPGIRYENILFTADGYYNASGTLVYEKGLSSKRHFPLFGIGFDYKLSNAVNLYANATEGYRAANFNDIRVTQPNLVVDPNLKDSKGYNIDLGARFKYRNLVNGELTLFYLGYKDRIGVVTRTRPDNTTYLLSTNVAASANRGLEFFTEVSVLKSVRESIKPDLFVFVSYAYTRSTYTRSDNDYLKSKIVEFSPEHIFRSGITFKTGKFSSTLNGSWISKQYSDANNTVSSTNGNNGIIPAYHVLDLSAGYLLGKFKIEGSINNLTKNKYFTRRATSYPGPGIIPAEPRVFALSLQIKL